MHGLSYSAGILFSFAILAGFLIVLKGAGEQIGWGFQLQNPAIILGLIYLLFTVGLNLTGFFEIRSGNLTNFGGSLAATQSHRGSFYTGILAALVATPCTAPFMGVAMGFALTQPAGVSLLVFLALGLGLALPYLLVTMIPPVRTKLPKPGHWMETFRQFLAFPMFISAIWLIWVYTQQTGSAGVVSALSGITAISFVIWLKKVMPEKGAGRMIAFTAMLAAIAVFLATFAAAVPQTQTPAAMEKGSQTQDTGSVQPYSPGALAALTAGDKPLFVNMTAAWCITCKINERVALNTETAKSLFNKHGIVYIKGDWTNYDPDISQYLERFERNGVPLYVYYGPRNKETNKRPEPVVLPQILSPGLIRKTLEGENS